MASRRQQKDEAKETSTPSGNTSTDQEISMCLGLLAEAKQAQVTAATLSVYVPRFRRFGIDDLVAGIEYLIATPRQEGQTSFPEVAVIVRAVADAERARRIREAKKFFCADCRSENGFLYFGRDGKRLRGVELVRTDHRSARRCPCGGTDHDWALMHRDREVNPEAYGTPDLASALRAQL